MVEEYNYKDGEFVLQSQTGMSNATGSVLNNPVVKKFLWGIAIGAGSYFIYKMLFAKSK